MPTATIRRRPLGYWSEYNAWWRDQYERYKTRPSSAAIAKWYDENADRIWGPEPNRPTLAAARIHAKCLRSVDAVRKYFRTYRATKGTTGKPGRSSKSPAKSEVDEESTTSETETETTNAPRSCATRALTSSSRTCSLPARESAAQRAVPSVAAGPSAPAPAPTLAPAPARATPAQADVPRPRLPPVVAQVPPPPPPLQSARCPISFPAGVRHKSVAKAPLSVAAATRLKHSPLRPPAKHPSWPSQHQVHHNAVPHVQLPLLPSSNAGSTDDMIKPHDDELPLDLIHLFSDDETQIFGPISTCSSELGLVSTGTRLGGPWPPCSDPLMPAHSAPEGSVHGMQLLRPPSDAAPRSMSELLLALDGAGDVKGHMQQCMQQVIKTEPQRPDLRHTLKPDLLDHDFPSSRQQGHLANMGPSKQLPMLGSPWELKTEVPRGMPQGQQLLGSFQHSSPRATFHSAQTSIWPAQGGSSAAHAAWGPASRMPMHEAQHCMARPPAGAPPALLPAGRTDIHGHGSHGHSAWCCAPSIVETSDDLLQQLLGGSDEPRWEQPLSGSNNTNDMYMHRWHSC